MPTYGILLENISAYDLQSNKRLGGEPGDVVTKTLHMLGVERTALHVAYVVEAFGATSKRASAWKPERTRVLREFANAGVDRILGLGPTAAATLLQLDRALDVKQRRGRFESVALPDGRTVPALITYSHEKVFNEPDLFRDFTADVAKLVTKEPCAEPMIDRVTLSTVGQTIRVLTTILSREHLVSCDVETTGLDPRSSRLESLGFGTVQPGGHGLSVIIPHELLYPKQPELVAFLKTCFGPDSPLKGRLSFHNVIFDLQHLYEYLGVWITHPGLTDTMLLHYALDERPTGRFAVHGLKGLSRCLYDAPDFTFDFEEWAKTPDDDKDYASLYYYHCFDLYYGAKLCQDFLTLMGENHPELLRLHDTLLLPAAQVLASMEYQGITIDKTHFGLFGRMLEDELADSEAALRRIATEHGVDDFNAGSPMQVNRFIYDVLGVKSTKRSTEKKTLDKIAAAHPGEIRAFITTLLNHRNTAKMLQTYVRGLLERVRDDNTISSDFFITGTATGRLSSSHVNLQNLPTRRGKEIKDGFIAKKGHVFVEADYANLEMRVAAWYSREPALVEAFANEEDVHRKVAAQVFGKTEDEVSAFERFMAKSINFGIIYQRSGAAIAAGAEMDQYERQGGTRWTVQEANAFVEDYLRQLPQLAAWIQETKERGLRDHKVSTPLGRSRRFPLILRQTRAEVGRAIVNTPIQSLASDLCLSSLIRIHHTLPTGARVALTVHDSIMVECRREVAEEVAALMRQEMTFNLPIEDRGFHFSVEFKKGTTWGDAKDWTPECMTQETAHAG